MPPTGESLAAGHRVTVKAERPWARHYHEVWQERAGDDRLPAWLRVASLAFGSHLDNGHARFNRGEIALILGKVDPDTGEVLPFDRSPGRSRPPPSMDGSSPSPSTAASSSPRTPSRRASTAATRACPIHAKRRREGRETRVEEARNSHSVAGSRVPNRHAVAGSGGRNLHSVASSEREPLSSLLPNPATRNDRGATA